MSGRGYTSESAPYKLPWLQIQLLAEYLFANLEFEEILGCLIPRPSDYLIEELHGAIIGLILNKGGYWQVTVFNYYLSLTYLALFLERKSRPGIGTEILHYCNVRNCIAINHIDEQPFQVNIDMQQCSFIVVGTDLINNCYCPIDIKEKCCPMKFNYTESTLLDPIEASILRLPFLLPIKAPTVSRRFKEDCWPCCICGSLFESFIDLWKHLNNHRRGRRILQDPNCLMWTMGFENYNNFQLHEIIKFGLDQIRAINNEKKRKARENYKAKLALRDNAIVSLSF